MAGANVADLGVGACELFGVGDAVTYVMGESENTAAVYCSCGSIVRFDVDSQWATDEIRLGTHHTFDATEKHSLNDSV